MLRLTQLFDITGHPAISLPCGRSKENCRPACSSSAAAAAPPSCWRSPQPSRRRWARYNSSSMIAPLFHAWERRLLPARPTASSGPSSGDSTGLRATATAPARPRTDPRRLGHGPRSPTRAVLRDAADRATTSSNGAPGDATCAGTVTFPSALATPHPENNVVHAPALPGRAKKGGARTAAGRSSCCRSGTPTPTGTSACAACWHASA